MEATARVRAPAGSASPKNVTSAFRTPVHVEHLGTNPSSANRPLIRTSSGSSAHCRTTSCTRTHLCKAGDWGQIVQGLYHLLVDPQAARHARCGSVGAVHLDHPRASRGLMQTVNILRDDSHGSAKLFLEVHQRKMTVVRTRRAEVPRAQGLLNTAALWTVHRVAYSFVVSLRVSRVSVCLEFRHANRYLSGDLSLVNREDYLSRHGPEQMRTPSEGLVVAVFKLPPSTV
jgi:hypothetical protein